MAISYIAFNGYCSTWRLATKVSAFENQLWEYFCPQQLILSFAITIIGLNILSWLEGNYLSSKQEFVCSPKAYSLPIFIYMNIPTQGYDWSFRALYQYCEFDPFLFSWKEHPFYPTVNANNIHHIFSFIYYTLLLYTSQICSIKHSNHSLMCLTQVFTYVTSSLSYRVPESILNKQDIENITLLYILQHCSRGTTPNHKCWTKSRGADMYYFFSA